MNTCATCRHWLEASGVPDGIGSCGRVPDLSYGVDMQIHEAPDHEPSQETLAYTVGWADDDWGAASMLYTRATFGCGQWEEK